MSDAFVLTVTEQNAYRKPDPGIQELLRKTILVDYATSLKLERKFDSAELKVSAFS